jgi:hypothetical protein
MWNLKSLGAWRGWLGAMIMTLLLPLPARAVPLISLGTFNLQQNTAGQNINIYVGGGDSGVQAVNFFLTTGDGGPDAGGSTGSGPGGADAPTVTSVNLTGSGSIFGSVGNTGTSPNGAQAPQFAGYQTQTTGVLTVALGTLTSHGVGTTTGTPSSSDGSVLLAVVTIDTTGFFSGSYSISVGGTVNNNLTVATESTNFPPEQSLTQGQTGDTKYAGFIDGTITIAPEPASLGLLGLAIPALLLRRRRGEVAQ